MTNSTNSTDFFLTFIKNSAISVEIPSPFNPEMYITIHFTPEVTYYLNEAPSLDSPGELDIEYTADEDGLMVEGEYGHYLCTRELTIADYIDNDIVKDLVIDYYESCL